MRRLSGWQVLLLAAVAGAILGAIALLFLTRGPSRPAPIVESSPESPAPSPSATSSQVAPPARPRTPSASLAHPAESFESAWTHFLDRFGDQLQPTTRDGRLTAVRGTMGQGREVNGFNPTDEQALKARAREIIDASSALLGIRSEFPLGESILSPGDISAQATFPQTYQGVEVAPQGAVRVAIGPHGELLGMQSAYNPNLKVTNQFRLTETEAGQKAVAASGNPSAQPGGATRLVWVVTGTNEGRCAYQFYIGGTQIIVDAESGGILYQRVRRTS